MLYLICVACLIKHSHLTLKTLLVEVSFSIRSNKFAVYFSALQLRSEKRIPGVLSKQTFDFHSINWRERTREKCIFNFTVEGNSWSGKYITLLVFNLLFWIES